MHLLTRPLSSGPLDLFLLLLSGLNMVERVLFQALVKLDDMVNSQSLLQVKPHETGTVTGYQVNYFTCTQFTEHFVA